MVLSFFLNLHNYQRSFNWTKTLSVVYCLLTYKNITS